MRLRTANHNHLRASRRRVRIAGLVFHEHQVQRLGSEHRKVKLSGYVRRHR